MHTWKNHTYVYVCIHHAFTISLQMNFLFTIQPNFGAEFAFISATKSVKFYPCAYTRTHTQFNFNSIETENEHEVHMKLKPNSTDSSI